MADGFGEAFEAVLADARRGAGPAFERLFHWLGRPVAAYLRGAGVEDPDGSSNEVFLRVFTALGGFDGGEDRFRSWVFTIAHNVVVDERRRAARRPRTTHRIEDAELGMSTPDAAEAALVTLGDERLRRLLAILSPDQRDVLLLRIVADLSVEETATVLGKPVSAVKSLRHRAVRTLRRRLETEAVPP